MSEVRPSIFYIDLLRFIAAIAVVVIHVLGPFRFLYGDISDSDWLAAMGYNSISRWAVPVFMMISGALLISDHKPFDCQRYLTRRLGKVVIPFVAWTLIYAFVGGFEGYSWSEAATVKLLLESTNEPVWYHLWFFYDFIPLYFVIPLLALVLYQMRSEHVKLLLSAWGLLTLMHLLKVETPLRQNIVLYSGYLVLGWYLFNRDNRPELKYWVVAGVVCLLLNAFGSAYLSFTDGKYRAFFMGYKSLNTVLIAGMLFVLAQCYAERIQGRLRDVVSIVSRYSLGIYLVHPLLLIPVRKLENGVYDFFGSNWLAIPLISLLVLIVALLVTMILAKLPFARRLVP
ncbi:acyltransferase [Alkalimarinus coralli]|uniref:acyltransferase n=1 Tax=Alkalimarinus coralli TaxID=2935863 RepID=UPI00202AF19D|nr:acyltransferase family protein [Alkalimarinus coralli]